MPSCSEGEVAQSCPTLYNPVDCNLLGFSVHRILQARILEWIAISFSRGSSRLRARTRVSSIGGRRFNLWDTKEVVNNDFARLFNVWDHLQNCMCASRRTHLIMAYFVGYACMSFTMKALAAATLMLHWNSIMNMLYEAMLWLYYCCCYSSCISQERGHVIAAMLARKE